MAAASLPSTPASGSRQGTLPPSSGNWEQSESSGHWRPTTLSTDSHLDLEARHSDLGGGGGHPQMILLWGGGDLPARRDPQCRRRVTLGDEQRAGVEHEVLVTAGLDQRREQRRLPGHGALPLGLVAQEVGRAGGVVGQVPAQLQADGLAARWGGRKAACPAGGDIGPQVLTDTHCSCCCRAHTHRWRRTPLHRKRKCSWADPPCMNSELDQAEEELGGRRRRRRRRRRRAQSWDGQTDVSLCSLLQCSSSLPSLQSSSPSQRNAEGMHWPFLHSSRPWL